MKHVFFFIFLLSLVSCTKEATPDPIQDDWVTLKNEQPKIEYSLAEDGQMCEVVNDGTDYCGMRWEYRGPNRYNIYRNDELECVWKVRFMGLYRIAEVTKIPVDQAEPETVFYLERI